MSQEQLNETRDRCQDLQTEHDALREEISIMENDPNYEPAEIEAKGKVLERLSISLGDSKNQLRDLLRQQQSEAAIREAIPSITKEPSFDEPDEYEAESDKELLGQQFLGGTDESELIGGGDDALVGSYKGKSYEKDLKEIYGESILRPEDPDQPSADEDADADGDDEDYGGADDDEGLI